MRNSFIPLGAAILLAACPMPQTVVRTPDTRPSIAIVGAPPGALLYVDGQRVGPAEAYAGNPNVLLIEAGAHEVDVRDSSGSVIYRQKIFVESELKTIRVH